MQTRHNRWPEGSKTLPIAASHAYWCDNAGLMEFFGLFYLTRAIMLLTFGHFRGSPRTVPSHPSKGRVLRRRELEKKIGHGHSWLYAEMRAGRFPASIEIGTRS